MSRRIPKLPMHRSSGTGVIVPNSPTSIRFTRYGCTNRPFYHLVVMFTKAHPRKPPVEQLGSYDPIPNKYNETLFAFNSERIMYWIGKGATISNPVAELLGLAGFYPLHPRSFFMAWRKRQKDEKRKKEQELANQESSKEAAAH